MAKHITQKVTFKNTKPQALFNLYMNAKQHALVTDAPAKISTKAGSAFSAYGGYCFGTTLYTVKDRLIAQTWRGSDWQESDADSFFTIMLEPKGKDTILHVIHANLPDNQAEGIKKGWFDFYWNPWKQHLAGKKIKRVAM
jgi:activator of HSP90 ATPase